MKTVYLNCHLFFIKMQCNHCLLIIIRMEKKSVFFFVCVCVHCFQEILLLASICMSISEEIFAMQAQFMYQTARMGRLVWNFVVNNIQVVPFSMYALNVRFIFSSSLVCYYQTLY